MRRVVLLVVFAICTTHFAAAQNLNHIKLSCDQVENSAKFKKGNIYQKDILLFVDMLRTTHPAFADGVDMPFDIDSLEKAAYNWAKKCTSAGDLGRYAQAIVSKLGDGHTTVSPNLTNFEIYPFMFAKVGDAYYLITSSKECETSLAKQITGINGAPIEDVLADFRSSFSCENDADFINRLSKQLCISTMWENSALRSADSTIALTFADDSSIVLRPIKKVKKNDLVTLLTRAPSGGVREMSMMPFLYKIIEDRGICYLQFQSCQDQNSVRKSLKEQGKLSEEKIEQYASRYPRFDEFLDSMFREVADRGIKKLVVDVRDNGGGHSGLCDVLLSWLKPDDQIKTGGSTIRFSRLWEQTYADLADRIKRAMGEKYQLGMTCDGEELSAMLNDAHSAAQNEGEELFVKNNDPHRVFKGDVIFIQNQNTYSSAGMLITSAVDNQIGMVIGTPSAYRPSNYGDILAWQLPYTQINGFVSHKLFYRPDRSKNDEPSILPSVEIPMSDEDFRENRDLYWQWCVNGVE